PGNPVSVLICLHRYVLHGLQRAMGVRNIRHEYANLVSRIQPHQELTCFMPVQLTRHTATLQVKPCPTRGSGDFISLLNTDGFVQVPAANSSIAENTALPFFRWSSS
ncbi:MAG: molybdopterin molybdenumtransferase MoeA, partial [Steroidobacter sp.]